MIMKALVVSVQRDSLLVRDLASGQNVRVNTPMAQQFCPGNVVLIRYNGMMTMSIPPQISAQSIRRIA